MALQHVLETFSLGDDNPFVLMLLEAGARRFKGELYMQTNIFNYVSPQEVLDLFEKRKEVNKELRDLYKEKADTERKISRAEVGMTRQEDFKWGRNDKERETQSREFIPKLWNELDRIKLKIDETQAKKSDLDIDKEQIELLTNLFQTGVYEVDVPTPA